MPQVAILIVDDNPEILLSVRLLLKPHYSDICTTDSPLKIAEMCKHKHFDIAILDMNFTRDADSGEEGFSCLKELLLLNPGIKVIFITAYGDIDKAVRAIKCGATDFILKPWQNEKLLAVVNQAAAGIMPNTSTITNIHGLTCKSTAMQLVAKQIKQVAPTAANILILGENGTGKEVAARAIWQESLRKNQIFLSVDLGSLSENLFESELFGHAKGAFTDAREERIGRFEAADGGTIFLDEIGNLSLACQAKLLTAIEKKCICRLGSHKTIHTDVRIIAATNENLLELVNAGRFRRDLFYRLNTVIIQLPPLRMRKEDILILAASFLAEYSQQYGKKIQFSTESELSVLLNYEWLGNIRELKHAMERAVILNSSGTLNISDCCLNENSANATESLSQTLDEREKEQIIHILDKVQGNISQAAKELGLTRASLYRRLDKLDIKKR